MCDKHPPAQTYDPKTPLAKANDWTRRSFLNRAALFLAAMGVPWQWRMEALEKLSGKIFGSSTAFAASSGNTFLLCFGWRSGYPMDNIICDAQDLAGPGDAQRNFHATPANVAAVPTTGGRNLYAPAQFSEALAAITPVGAPFADRMAKMTACKNTTGHMNGSSALWMPGGTKGTDSNAFVSHAAKMATLNPTLLSNYLVYGAKGTFDYGQLGSLSASFTPTYGSTAQFQGLFKPTDLKAADNTTLSSDLVNEINTVQANIDEQFIKTIETREGVDALRAGQAAVAALLKTNLSALIDPNNTTTAGYISALTTGVTVPNTRFSTGSVSIAQQVAVALRCIELGICNGFGHTIDTGDWHNTQAGSDGTNNQGITDATGRNDGTAQARHAAWFGEFFAALLNLADGIAVGGSTIGEKLRIVHASEFLRTINGGPATGDNGDGGHTGSILIGNGLNGGTYGDHTTAMKSLKPDLATGDATVEGQLDQTNLVNTIRRFVGLTDSTEHDATAVLTAMVP